jgi:hypothetical protein
MGHGVIEEVQTMADDSRKQRRHASKAKGTEPPDRPDSFRQEAVTQLPAVTNIEDWKKRPVNKDPARTAETRQMRGDLHLLSRVQKQAALLRLILSDTIEEGDLEAMIQTATSFASTGGG